MGGGTSWGDIPSKTTDEIKKIISNAIPKAESPKIDEERRIRNVFISFHSEDENLVNLLRIQAKRENTDLDFRDYSIKEPIEQWRKNVIDRIAATSATIVMIGPDTASRKNVQYEIEQSYALGKKVLGVRIHRDQHDPVPELMRKNNATIVNWNLRDIQAELDKV